MFEQELLDAFKALLNSHITSLQIFVHYKVLRQFVAKI